MQFLKKNVPLIYPFSGCALAKQGNKTRESKMWNLENKRTNTGERQREYGMLVTGDPKITQKAASVAGSGVQVPGEALSAK